MRTEGGLEQTKSEEKKSKQTHPHWEHPREDERSNTQWGRRVGKKNQAEEPKPLMRPMVR